MNVADQNQVTYLRWLSREHPALYARSMLAARRDLRGLGRLGWINFVIQAVATVGSAVVAKKQVDKQVAVQKKALALSDAQAAADREQAAKFALLDTNTKRAQAGLPPVDITGNVIAPQTLPNAQALLPFTAQQNLAPTWIRGVPNYVTGIGAVVLGLGLLKLARVW